MGKWDKYKKNKPEKNDSNSLNNGMGKTVIRQLILTAGSPLLFCLLSLFLFFLYLPHLPMYFTFLVRSFYI